MQQQEELDPDRVLDYLLTHPGFLETLVIGPHISSETFKKWTLKRSGKLRKDSRKQLLTGYTTSNGRLNTRRWIGEYASNNKRLLYELALTCAQIVGSEQFDLLVKTSIAEEPNHDGDAPATNGQSKDVATATNAAMLSVIPGDVPGTVKLRRLRKQRKPPVHVLKLIDCNEVVLGEVHFFSVVNDRDSQYLQILSTWACSTIHFAKRANQLEFPQPFPVASPLPPEDVEYLNRQRKLNAFLLDVVKSLFANVTMDEVVLKIIHFAQTLVDADRASLFLVDHRTNEIFARIFDVRADEDEEGEKAGGGGGDSGDGRNGQAAPPPPPPQTKIHVNEEGNKEIRFPIGKGVAGRVALTGESLNIDNAYDSSLFNPEIDSKTGYHTESILCMPLTMRNSVIGVVQMVNKRHGDHFTPIDEEAFSIFANYCALALHQARLYDKIRRSEQKYRVALEVLAYHGVCNKDEVNKLKRVQTAERIPELDLFEFNGNRLSEMEKPLTAIYMFKTLFNGVIQYEQDDLIRFILTVRKNYRHVPYHNWSHGWVVAQGMFCFLRQNKIFTPLEQLALFVAAICHDLDHRGKSNAYMKASSTPLAAIYTTSVMEHHHFNSCLTILQHEGHNVLKHLDADSYKQVLILIKHCILATDLALFFPNKANLAAIVKENSFDWSNQKHRGLAQAILMTACDLIATAKPWKVQTETVRVIFEEFYQQGDAERLNGREPIPMMDRNRANELPQMQVGFMRSICIPCYEVLSNIIPEAGTLKERTMYNASKWEELIKDDQQKKE